MGGTGPDVANLVRDAIVLREPGLALADVVHHLLERARIALPSLPIDELRDAIAEREQMMPTASGDGVALPHTYHAAVRAPVCFAAAVPAGLRDPGLDGKPISLVFLVLSPVGDSTGHLAALAAVSRLVESERAREVLVQQQSGALLLGVILDHD